MTAITAVWSTRMILDEVQPGDPHEWKDEFEWLWTVQPDKMAALIGDIIENGIHTPIEIGQTARGQYRMWDGHHRVAAALALGLPRIPVHLNIENEAA
jgi:ParB-like chromosome segregation protein Spo0J